MMYSARRVFQIARLDTIHITPQHILSQIQGDTIMGLSLRICLEKQGFYIASCQKLYGWKDVTTQDISDGCLRNVVR